ncbi:PilN domain-containing protein [Candidatus Wolfebacteria bacterium]|nr:PilN domain-containing protein [Candidatus Wolfebacteria bacterium]
MPEIKSLLEQQLERGEELRSTWPWRLLVFTALAFVILILVYAGMSFGYAPYLNSEIKKLDQKLADLNSQLESDQPKALMSLYSELLGVQGLLESHPLASKFFDFLEKSTDSRVYFTNLSFSVEEKSIKLEGIASDHNSLVRQIEIFRRSPRVKAIFLDDSRTRDQNDAQFILRLIVDDAMFK